MDDISMTKGTFVPETEQAPGAVMVPLGGDLMHMYNMAKHALGYLPQARQDYAPEVRDYLNKYGKDRIFKMEMCRNPINQALRNVLNTVSLGAMKQAPDNLFHLWMRLSLITPEGIKRFKLEKNHIIEFAPSLQEPTNVYPMRIVRSQDMNVNTLLEKTQQAMGDDFFVYDAFKNNCQDFMLALVKANHLETMNPGIDKFIKQDLTSVLADSRVGAIAAPISRHITDLAASFDHLIKGKGIQYYEDSDHDMDSESDME